MAPSGTWPRRRTAAAGGQDVAKSQLLGVPSDAAGAGLLPAPASDASPQPLAKTAAVAKTADSAAAKPFWGRPNFAQ